MFKPTPAVLGELHALAHPEVEHALASALRMKKPDLTDTLLLTYRQMGNLLGRTLQAAATRAACARLGRLHPGATIEVRVPPFAAVQIGFGQGATHTRGTPPNVVEMSATTFLDLTTGLATWEGSAGLIRASGAHAQEAAAAFPL